MKRNNSLKVNNNIIKQDFGYSKNVLQSCISPDVWLSLMQKGKMNPNTSSLSYSAVVAV